MKKIISIFFCLLSISCIYSQSKKDSRLDYDGMDNPLLETEYPEIYCIKPHYSKKKAIEENEQYCAVVYEKEADDEVVEFKNVVLNWQGISGWNGRVETSDFTFITADYKQYIVKAQNYLVEYKTIESVKNEEPNEQKEFSEKEASLKQKLLVFEIICSFLMLLLVLIVFFFVVLIPKQKRKWQQNQVLIIQEQEKSKISREIHDTVVQDIRAIRIEAEAIETDDILRKDRVVEDITNCIIKMRNICYDLSPAELSLEKDEQINIISIIETLCKQFTTRTNISSSIQIDKTLTYPELDRNTCFNIVRVFQEILNNINKHSYATKFTVLIKLQNEKGEEFLTIFVIDDGVGCSMEDINPKKQKNHFGIMNMQERMKSIGGKIDFFSAPNEGMKVVLKIRT